MKLKSLLALVSIFAGIFLANTAQAVVKEYSTKLGAAKQWETAMKGYIERAGFSAPTSKFGKYVASGAVGGVVGAAAIPIYIAGLGRDLGEQLDASAKKAELAGVKTAQYSFQALSDAVTLATVAAMGIAAYTTSPALAVWGGLTGLVGHALMDINDLLEEVKIKIDKNELSPQEAIKLAEQLEADAKELKEHTASAQQAAA